MQRAATAKGQQSLRSWVQQVASPKKVCRPEIIVPSDNNGKRHSSETLPEGIAKRSRISDSEISQNKEPAYGCSVHTPSAGTCSEDSKKCSDAGGGVANASPRSVQLKQENDRSLSLRDRLRARVAEATGSLKKDGLLASQEDSCPSLDALSNSDRTSTSKDSTSKNAGNTGSSNNAAAQEILKGWFGKTHIHNDALEAKQAQQMANSFAPSGVENGNLAGTEEGAAVLGQLAGGPCSRDRHHIERTPSPMKPHSRSPCSPVPRAAADASHGTREPARIELGHDPQDATVRQREQQRLLAGPSLNIQQNSATERPQNQELPDTPSPRLTCLSRLPIRCEPQTPCATAMDPPSTPPPSHRCSGKSPECTPTPPSSQASRRSQDEGYVGPRPRPPPTDSGADRGPSIPPKPKPHVPTPVPVCSVKDLKSRLIEHGVDVTGCMERSELECLWATYDDLRQKPLSELRERCAAVGEHGRRIAHGGSVDECARFLCSPNKSRLPSVAVQGGSPLCGGGSSSSTAGGHTNNISRERTASAEIARILRLRKNAYRSMSEWGAAVLNCGRLQHHHAFRELMRILHPDRIGSSSDASTAIELVKEARAHCERASLRAEPPCPPKNLTASMLCGEPGRRRILIEWGAAPGSLGCESAPIKRYIVQVHDPAYGRAIKIAVLESDYSEELRRFVPVEELRSYVLDEQHLRKMPSVFQQQSITVQIAAASEAGQSGWAVLQMPLLSIPRPRKSQHRWRTT